MVLAGFPWDFTGAATKGLPGLVCFFCAGWVLPSLHLLA